MSDEFEVVYLKNVRMSMVEILKRGRTSGMEREVFDAAQLIDTQLRANPREFGDPLATLVGLKLDLFSRGVKPLIVFYGVHQVERLVFVNKIRVVPFSGF